MLSQHVTGTRVAFFPWAHGLTAHDMFPQHVARRRVVCFPPARCPKAYGMFPLARGSKVCGKWYVFPARDPKTCGMRHSRRAAGRHVGHTVGVYLPGRGSKACGMLSLARGQRHEGV